MSDDVLDKDDKPVDSQVASRYFSWGFGGVQPTSTVSNSASSTTNDWAEGQQGVYFFKHGGGSKYVSIYNANKAMTQGDYTLTRMWNEFSIHNDDISSIVVFNGDNGEGYEVILYEHDNFQGHFDSFNSIHSNIPNTAIHPNYTPDKGNWRDTNGGSIGRNTPYYGIPLVALNDRISSIKVRAIEPPMQVAVAAPAPPDSANDIIVEGSMHSNFYTKINGIYYDVNNLFLDNATRTSSGNFNTGGAFDNSAPRETFNPNAGYGGSSFFNWVVPSGVAGGDAASGTNNFVSNGRDIAGFHGARYLQETNYSGRGNYGYPQDVFFDSVQGYNLSRWIFTPPGWCQTVVAIALGGGGGGGGASYGDNDGWGGDGGGAAGMVIAQYHTSKITSIKYTIGGGGGVQAWEDGYGSRGGHSVVWINDVEICRSYGGGGGNNGWGNAVRRGRMKGGDDGWRNDRGQKADNGGGYRVSNGAKLIYGTNGVNGNGGAACDDDDNEFDGDCKNRKSEGGGSVGGIIGWTGSAGGAGACFGDDDKWDGYPPQNGSAGIVRIYYSGY